MRIHPEPGGLTVVLSYDPARARQILAQNRARFRRRFYVNLSAESVEAEDDEGRLDKYKIIVSDAEGQKRLVAVSLKTFMERMLPQLDDALVVMMGGPEVRRFPWPPPMPRRSTALVLIIEVLEDLPDGWERDVVNVVEAYFADEQEIRELLGAPAPELRGVTLGELERIAQEPRDRWVVEADRMKNVRLRMIGLENMGPTTPFAELPLDSYMRRHLSAYLGRPACLVFTGAPGSGKTTIAKSMARWFRNSYLLDAGRIMEKSGAGFLAHVLVTLRHMDHVSLVINELDHLVLAERRYMARFLSFLEENSSVWIGGTVIDISPLMKEQAGTFHSELLRPGRVSEVIPVPPPFERATREAVVRQIAGSLSICLGDSDVRAIASAAPLLYPSDYISLVQRYAREGRRAVRAFVDAYDVEARAASVEELVDRCERLGNTSTSLIECVRSHLESVYNY